MTYNLLLTEKRVAQRKRLKTAGLWNVDVVWIHVGLLAGGLLVRLLSAVVQGDLVTSLVCVDSCVGVVDSGDEEFRQAWVVPVLD